MWGGREQECGSVCAQGRVSRWLSQALDTPTISLPETSNHSVPEIDGSACGCDGVCPHGRLRFPRRELGDGTCFPFPNKFPPSPGGDKGQGRGGRHRPGPEKIREPPDVSAVPPPAKEGRSGVQVHWTLSSAARSNILNRDQQGLLLTWRTGLRTKAASEAQLGTDRKAERMKEGQRTGSEGERWSRGAGAGSEGTVSEKKDVCTQRGTEDGLMPQGDFQGS